MASDLFTGIGIETPHLDADLLLEAVLGMSKLEMQLAQGLLLTDEQLSEFFAKISRRLCLEPVAYILGCKEFYGLAFLVSPDVLIPRPDTEIIVEECLKRLPLDGAQEIIELCVGSGAIAVSLLHERLQLRVHASDISPKALDMSWLNAKRLGVSERLTLLQGDLFNAFPKKIVVSLIVANPPYIGTSDYGELATNVRGYEPRLALDAGDDELLFYRRILRDAPDFLVQRGFLVLEIGFNQASAIKNLVTAVWSSCEVIKDLAGHDRCIVLQKQA